MTEGPQWVWLGADRFWTYNVGDVCVTLEPRPAYCDRGRWYGKVFGLETDGQDGFPRYFMDLDRAKAEMADWLAWRLKRAAE